MNERENVFAYTAPGADFPEFISVNRVGEEIEIHVRASKENGGGQGQIKLPLKLSRELRNGLQQACGIVARAAFARETGIEIPPPPPTVNA